MNHRQDTSVLVTAIIVALALVIEGDAFQAGTHIFHPTLELRRQPRLHNQPSFAPSTTYPAKHALVERIPRRRQHTAWHMTPTSTTASSSMISSEHLQQLAQNDYVIIPDFIPPDLVAKLHDDVSQLLSKDKFRQARIGQDFSNTLNENIRIAQTCFLGPGKLTDCPNQAREEMCQKLEQLRVQLSGNPTLQQRKEQAAVMLDAGLSELLYAHYPEGGYYRRHCDSVQGSASVLRAYSLLLYLNKEWKQEDGGQLRLHMDSGRDYLPEGEEPNYLDVDPIGGTLVLFRSEKIPHEVLDTSSRRLAVVGWYNRPMTSTDVDALTSEEDKTRLAMLGVAAAMVTAGVVMMLV